MKAVIFDFDGTLTKGRKGSNCWHEIWKHIDDLDYDNFLFGQYLENKIDHKTWLKLIFERYKFKGVKRKDLSEIAEKISLISGARETLKQLNESNIKIFVLSGGVRQIIEDVLKKDNLQQYITLIETYDLIFDESGELVDYARPNMHNPESKNEFIELLKQKYNLKGEDILFVGNSKNDEKAYLSGVKTLCINPDGANTENKKIWNYVIENCENLKEILKFCEIPMQK